MALVRKAADVAMGARQVVQDLGRLQDIVQVLARHGLGWLVAEVEVPGIGLLRRTFEDGGRTQPTPERVCAVIRELGPTFVKLGQVLSTRDDLLPAAWIDAFQSLQDDVGPIPWDDVVGVLAESFATPDGRADFRPENLFERFDREPLATASIAQVHRAVTRDGDDVAVKVQRPGIRRKIQNDLSILAFLARQVQVQVPELSLVDLPATIGVLRASLAEETDFRNEARNTDQFRTNFADISWIVIPRVYPDLSTADVLTLQFLDGVPIARAREQGYDMKLVGERYVSAAFKMLLEDGCFHGDLHPGNVFVLPRERLGILDFGLVGRLSPENKQDLVDIFFAVQRRDARTIARIYWELAIKPGHVDYGAWETDVQELMEKQLFGKAMAEIQIADFVRDLMQRAHKHGVQASTAYTLFFKALLTTEGLAKYLVPEVDPMELMRPYLGRMVQQQYSVARLQRELLYWALSFRYSGRRLPVVIGSLMEDLQEGRLRLKTVVETPPAEQRRADERTNRMAMAVTAAGLFLAGSVALTSELPRLWPGLPLPTTLAWGLGVATWASLVRAVRASRRG